MSVPRTEQFICSRCQQVFDSQLQQSFHESLCGVTFKNVVYDNDLEPRDRLNPQDMAVINSALHLYYAESQECLAGDQELHRIASLSRRLADVSLRWVAEEVNE